MTRRPAIPTGQLKRWSYSAWSLRKRCLYALYLSYVVPKQKDWVAPSNYAMDRGNEVHKKAEFLLKGEITGTPPPLKKFAAEFKALAKLGKALIIEQYWNFNTDFTVAAPYQGTLVVKSDVCVPPSKKSPTAINIDHKTGKEYPEHENQAELSAVATKATFPASDGVDFEFWYVDLGNPVAYHFDNRELQRLKVKWIAEGKKMMALREFPMEPSASACTYCFHRSDKEGGKCDGWRKAG
jgi:hypothetical protein